MARYYFSTILVEDFKMKTAILVLFISLTIFAIGKRHGFKKHDQFTLNTTSCFWGKYQNKYYYPICAISQNFVTKIMNKLGNLLFLKQKFCENSYLGCTGSSITLIKYFVFPL